MTEIGTYDDLILQKTKFLAYIQISVIGEKRIIWYKIYTRFHNDHEISSSPLIAMVKF